MANIFYRNITQCTLILTFYRSNILLHLHLTFSPDKSLAKVHLCAARQKKKVAHLNKVLKPQNVKNTKNYS